MNTKLLFFTIVFTSLLMLSCSKNTNPERFDKIVIDSSWRVGKAQFGTSNKTGDFNNHTFYFEKGKTIEIISAEDTVKGYWSRGSDKKPLIFYMSFAQTATKYLAFDDDWIVTYLTKDEFRLERNGSSSEDEIIFRKKV